MSFNIEQMLETSIENALSTRLIPVPQGEYEASIQRLKGRSVTRKDNSEVPIITVFWEINDIDGQVEAVTGRTPNIVRQDLWLDMTAENTLDTSPGANVSLGRLRDALGQNRPGERWSFNNMIGSMARILVTHRTDDNNDTYAEVKSVKAL